MAERSSNNKTFRNQNTAAAVVRRYSTGGPILPIIGQRCNGGITTHTIHYLHYLWNWKERRASASDLAKGLCVEIGVSVTDQTLPEGSQPLWTTSKKKKNTADKTAKTAGSNLTIEHEPKPDQVYHSDCIVLTMKHQGRNVLIWSRDDIYRHHECIAKQ